MARLSRPRAPPPRNRRVLNDVALHTEAGGARRLRCAVTARDHRGAGRVTAGVARRVPERVRDRRCHRQLTKGTPMTRQRAALCTVLALIAATTAATVAPAVA